MAADVEHGSAIGEKRFVVNPYNGNRSSVFERQLPQTCSPYRTALTEPPRSSIPRRVTSSTYSSLASEESPASDNAGAAAWDSRASFPPRIGAAISEKSRAAPSKESGPIQRLRLSAEMRRHPVRRRADMEQCRMFPADRRPDTDNKCQ